MSFRLGFAGFVVLALTSFAATAAHGALYGVAPFAGARLYTFNETTGAPTLVAPLSDPNVQLAGIEFDNAGRLLGIDSFRIGGGAPRRLWQVDTTTGALTALFTLPTSDVLFEGGFSVDPTNNLGYFVEEASLYTVNLATGAFTSLGQLTFNGSPMSSSTNVDGLAFRGGQLYGFITIQTPGLNGHLVRIDKNTRAVTDVGASGFLPDATAGLTYHPGRDVFYVATKGVAGLYTLDPATGAATLVGNHNLADLSGLAFIPEPGSAALLAVAAAAALVRRRRPTA